MNGSAQMSAESPQRILDGELGKDRAGKRKSHHDEQTSREKGQLHLLEIFVAGSKT